MQNPKISCVIHTFNSEQYLEVCLSSVRWCDEIVVIDMHSTDRTVEIAKKFGAKVYFHENVGFADPARPFGLSQCSHSWVLAIDSDEIVPPKLAERLWEIAKNDCFDVVKISFRNYFFGRELLGSGWGYKSQVIPRFYKKGFITYGTEVHNFVRLASNARLGTIVDRERSICHLNYYSVHQFIRKLNTYTDNEVLSTKYHYKNHPAARILYHSVREFGGRFFLMGGYRDGWVGLYLALAMAFYRASAVAKANTPSAADVDAQYIHMAGLLVNGAGSR